MSSPRRGGGVRDGGGRILDDVRRGIDSVRLQLGLYIFVG